MIETSISMVNSKPKTSNRLAPIGHYQTRRKTTLHDIRAGRNPLRHIEKEIKSIQTINYSKPKSELKNNQKNKLQREKNYEHKPTSCRMTFIFDPNGRFSYWMGNTVILQIYESGQIFKMVIWG